MFFFYILVYSVSHGVIVLKHEKKPIANGRIVLKLVIQFVIGKHRVIISFVSLFNFSSYFI
jgi:hypothetical protein